MLHPYREQMREECLYYLRNNLGLSFGAFDLFQGISVTIANDSKIGLIGPNGIGKTSLMMILAGLNQPTTGSIHIARGKRLGYLRQEASSAFANSGTVLTRVYARDAEPCISPACRTSKHALHKLEADMAGGCYTEEMLTTYGDLQAAFEHAGGYDYDLRIQQTLQGLGLGKQTWDMPLGPPEWGSKDAPAAGTPAA